RIRLDLTVELDEIDEQAHRIAVVRHQLGETPVGWLALVERVAALSLYANRLLVLEGELARQEAADRAGMVELSAAARAAGAVRDELATEHVRALADELTNSETSQRNAT